MDAAVFRHHVFQGADRGWEADPHGLADFTGHSLESGAQEIQLVTIPDFHFGQGQEIPAHAGPLKVPTSVSQPPLQLIKQDQGQKPAKHMTAYGGIPLVEDGPGVHHGLGGPEELLHQQQALVLHRPCGRTALQSTINSSLSRYRKIFPKSNTVKFFSWQNQRKRRVEIRGRWRG